MADRIDWDNVETVEVPLVTIACPHCQSMTYHTIRSMGESDLNESGLLLAMMSIGP